MNKADQTKTVLSQLFVENGQAAAPQKNLLDRVGVLLALLALYIIWGSTYLGMRMASESIPVFMMSGMRFILAGGSLYGYLRARRIPNPSKAQWMGAAVVGLLLLVGGNTGMAFAVQWVATSLAAVAVTAPPLWAALVICFLGRWPPRVELPGPAVGPSGLVLLHPQHCTSGS